MFHKILVALDYSNVSREVLDTATALAKASGASLTLLHVLSSSEPDYPDLTAFVKAFCHLDPKIRNDALLDYAQQWQKFEVRNRKLLLSFAREAEVAGVKVDCIQGVKDPGLTICQEAQTGNFDLIVMGRRGYSGLQELFIGSVSNYVLHHAPCAVLTVQGLVSSKSQSFLEQPAAVAS